MRTILCCLLLAAGQLFAQATDVKGVALGADFSDAKKLFERLNCYGASGEVTWCSLNSTITMEDVRASRTPVRFTYGGAIAKNAIIYGLQDKFAGIRISVHPNWFDKLSEALMEKFGKPTKQGPIPFRTRAGVEHPNEEIVWERADAIITYRRLSGSIDDSQLTIYSRDYVAHYEAKEKADREKAKKDL